MALPLTRLNEACEEMEEFIRFHLGELQSQHEMQNLIGKLSSRITDHQGRLRQLLRSGPLRHPEVAPFVLVGLAAERLLESNFFPGLLEGLLGSLGITASRESDPPLSSHEGARRAWSTAVGKALSQIEQREVKAPETRTLPPGLDPHRPEDLLGR